MRIIAGDFKGRKLVSPEDRSVRPTSDKVREALFSILYYAIPGAVVCDLFAGTGALGLEALSRGASRCYFCDGSKDSIRLVRENVRLCGAEDRADVFYGDYRQQLGRLREKIDVFFLDPPYGSGEPEIAAAEIYEKGLLAEEGLIVLEHRKEDEAGENLGGFAKFKERSYGKVVLSFYGLP